MKVLKGILKDSLGYYRGLERKLRRRLAGLPQGSVKRRKIKGRVYYYLQRRKGARVVHRYLGREKPSGLIAAIRERQMLKREMLKVKAALKLLSKRKRSP